MDHNLYIKEESPVDSKQPVNEEEEEDAEDGENAAVPVSVA